MQRQSGLRTVVAAVGRHPVVVELNGRVIADPNASGRVQASQSGRVVAAGKALAVLGQRVRQGEVLGYLQPVTSSLERGGQAAQLAEIAAQLEVAERRVRRLEQLDGVVPAKEIEAARYDAEGLRARRDAIGTGLDGLQPLTAPVAGVVAAVSVVVGQIVEAREKLFEVVDPARLAVEALAYDVAFAQAVEGASALVDGGSVELAFVGGGKVLREQALPLLFRVLPATGGEPHALAIGQPLKVLARTGSRQAGVALPAEAVSRGPGGEPIVWAHTGAERFVPRKVRLVALDGARVAVTEGVAAGDRVVVRGATSLSQVR
jgi:biotin carboxyl carrier protein